MLNYYRVIFTLLSIITFIGVFTLVRNKKRLQRKLDYIEWNIESVIDSINSNIEEYIIKQYIKWKKDYIILLYITKKGIVKIKYYYKTGEIK